MTDDARTNRGRRGEAQDPDRPILRDAEGNPILDADGNVQYEGLGRRDDHPKGPNQPKAPEAPEEPTV